METKSGHIHISHVHSLKLATLYSVVRSLKCTLLHVEPKSTTYIEKQVIAEPQKVQECTPSLRGSGNCWHLCTLDVHLKDDIWLLRHETNNGLSDSCGHSSPQCTSIACASLLEATGSNRAALSIDQHQYTFIEHTKNETRNMFINNLKKNKVYFPEKLWNGEKTGYYTHFLSSKSSSG